MIDASFVQNDESEKRIYFLVQLVLTINIIRENRKKSCKIQRNMITCISVTLKDKQDMAPWSSG